MKAALIAAVCHAVNAAYCASIGDPSVPWAEAPEDQRASALKGVEHTLANQDVTPEQLHQEWLAARTAAGWVYGEAKDPVAKTHPCMVPYDQLPESQKVKDHLFRAVVMALKDIPDAPDGSEGGKNPEDVYAALVKPKKVELPPMTVTPEGFVAIEYIGRRPNHRESIYGTEVLFPEKGSVRMVKAEAARKMVLHADVYRPVVLSAAVAAETPKGKFKTEAELKKEQDDRAKQDEVELLRNSITRMNKQTLAKWAKDNFNMELTATELEPMRAEATRLFDQFGVPGTKAAG